MSDDHSLHAHALTFAIDYQLPGVSEFNPEFKGSGTLAILPAGPTYVFRGKLRATFSGDEAEFALGADDIWNVVAHERVIRCTTRRRLGEGFTRQFLFYCANADEARDIARLLPRRLDDEFLAERDFATRLHSLSRERHPAAAVTNAIVAGNILVFVVMGTLGAGWFQVESLMPYVLYGANNGAATTGGEWWRLLTSMFMHYGLIHLALNMWALFEAGHFLERLQGRALYALTYFASGLGGGFASILWHGDKTWSAGASGAVFGVYGAILGYALREKQTIPAAIFKALLKSSLIFAGYNIFYGLAARGIDNAAHLGGAVAGFAFGWLLAMPLDRDTRTQLFPGRVRLAIGALAALIIAGFFATPRFNYRMHEELALDNANHAFETREAALVTQHEAALQAIARGEDGTAHAAWIDATLVPFFTEWQQALEKLSLQPGLLSEQRRALNLRYFAAFNAALRQLATDLRARDPEALARYVEAKKQALAEIEGFNQRQASP